MGILIGALAAAAFAALIFVYMRKKNRDVASEHDGLRTERVGDGLRRLQANQERYRELTAASLAEIPDELLLEAVLSNLWAKMRPDLADARDVLSGLSEGRKQLFAMYAVTGGVLDGGFSGLLKGEDAAFAADCEAGLRAVGANASADVLREALASAEPDLLSDAYAEAFDAEDGRARMVIFIRENAVAFTDRS